MKPYVITAAAGRIGGRVARGLLAHGHPVRVVSRSAERLQSLVALGATPCIGDLRDAGFVERTLAGAGAALLIVRADRSARDYRRDFADIGTSFAAAARLTALDATVFVSSLGAHDDRNRGLIVIHRDVELALATVPELAVINLRAPFFAENLFYFLPAMRARNAAQIPIDPDTAIDVAPTSEIAAVALRLLLEAPRQVHQAHELWGHQRTTMREIAERLATLLGRAFPFERMPRAAHVDAMIEAGSSADFANLMNDAWDTFSRGGSLRDPRTAAATTSAVPLETFLRTELAPALAGAPP